MPDIIAIDRRGRLVIAEMKKPPRRRFGIVIDRWGRTWIFGSPG